VETIMMGAGYVGPARADNLASHQPGR
jgi:hypothetical protein